MDRIGEITDFDSLRQAMAENEDRPEGAARNARSEQLLADAEKLNIPLAVIEALRHQLSVYNYSSEKAKMFVPFARLLRLWDEHPEDFDAYETHALFWAFKWVSSGMLDQPHIPLASIEKWLSEMEHRYRLAGHSERAVRDAEFSIAAHVGDIPRAERAYAAWLSADRDEMADCHACELHAQAWWQAELCQDTEALELWRPVLEGEYTCAHEPHAALASSLLPLLRLGRFDEARAHHLRGLRLVRSTESMRGAYAEHVEFCALTGNEARGVELLAERPAYFTDDGHPRSKLEFMSVVAHLMGRLVELGHGEQPVPGPAGRDWTARELAAHARGEALELAARFDRRNGTTYVSEQARTRMDRRPLTDRLPLGVGGSRPPLRASVPAQRSAHDAGAGAGAGTGAGTGAGVASSDLPALLAEARRRSEALRPDSVEAWAAVARAAGAAGAAGSAGATGATGATGANGTKVTGGPALGVRDRAEIADHRGLDRGPEGAGDFERAAELFAEAGDPGEALAAGSRAAYVRALTGHPDEALSTVTGLCEQVRALYAEGGTGVRQTASVLMGRARILTHRARKAAAEAAEEAAGRAAGEPSGATAAPDGTPGTTLDDTPDGTPVQEITAAEESLHELLALVDGHTDDVRVAAREAEAHALLGELAALSGDAVTAVGLVEHAVREFTEAGLPWYTVEHEVELARLAQQLGDVARAERALLSALEQGGPYLEPSGQAQLRVRVAELLARRGEAAQAAEQALEAAHWADEAGLGHSLGAWARHLLGGSLLRLGRWAEAAEVLESALPDLTAETHGDGAIVQTRWWLADCLTELGEHRSAAEHLLKAADVARRRPDQHDHALLAHRAGEALDRAGLPAEADRAYTRAGELWKALGDIHGLVRSLRARAWLALGTDGGRDEARALMTRALEECEAAVAAAGTDAGADADVRRSLVAELADSYQQFGGLLTRATAGEEEADHEDEEGAGNTDGNGAGAGKHDAVHTRLEEALTLMTHAVTTYATLGEAALHPRTGAEITAAWIEADLDRRTEAEARAHAVLDAYGDVPEDSDDRTVRTRRRQVEQLLAFLDREEPTED